MDWVNLPWDKVFVIVTVVVSGMSIAVGVLGPAIGQAIVAGKAMSALARQPEAADTINQALILSLAMLESLAIYVLAVILILIFANPLKEIMIQAVQ